MFLGFELNFRIKMNRFFNPFAYNYAMVSQYAKLINTNFLEFNVCIDELF